MAGNVRRNKSLLANMGTLGRNSLRHLRGTIGGGIGGTLIGGLAGHFLNKPTAGVQDAITARVTGNDILPTTTSPSPSTRPELARLGELMAGLNN